MHYALCIQHSQKLLDTKPPFHRMSTRKEGVMKTIHFSSLIDIKLVYLHSKLTDINEIYTFMVRQMMKRYHIPHPESELLQQLTSRRLDDGILLPIGTAIPHLHLEDFNDSIISVLIPERPIQTDCGVVKIIFLILSKKSENSLYLHMLKSIIQICKDEQLFAQLLAAKTPAAFQALISDSDYIVQKPINVEDVMSVNVLTVTPENTLEELSNLFYEHSVEYFPVVKNNDEIIGEVTVLDYIMAGFPEYTKGLKNLNFLKSFEPFAKLLKEEPELLVKSIMREVEVSVLPDTSLFKAVFLMNKHSCKNIPVVEKGKVVGIINFMDILRKVLKG